MEDFVAALDARIIAFYEYLTPYYLALDDYLSAEIDFDFDLLIEKNALGTWSPKVTCQHDGFPSYTLSVTRQSETQVLYQGPPQLEHSLLGPQMIITPADVIITVNQVIPCRRTGLMPDIPPRSEDK